LADVLDEGDEYAEPAQARLLRTLENDGFAPGPDGRLRAVAAWRVDLPLDRIADVEVLQEHLDRIDREVDTDRSSTISAVKGAHREHRKDRHPGDRRRGERQRQLQRDRRPMRRGISA
jgi:hypothetical protein